LGYELKPPMMAILPEKDAVSINTAMAMRAAFGQDSPNVDARHSARWPSSIYRVECPQLRRRMAVYRMDDGPLRVEGRPNEAARKLAGPGQKRS
jgi:hypothetical protein